MTAVVANTEDIKEKRYIYNHDIMNCTADGVTGNHLYSGRALGISEPWDIVQLHPELEPLWEDIQEHYQHVGLSHSQNILWHIDLKELAAHIDYQPSVFYFGPDECQYWGDYDWQNTVEYINSKNNFVSLAQKLEVDIPNTLCFDSIDEIDAHIADNDVTYPCYLKAAISVSGVGIYRCENRNELLVSLANFNHSTPVQIQEEVRTESFLNLQYKVVGDELVRLAASEQILDGFVHQGNRVPPAHEPWNSVEPMAIWLQEHGMKGIFAFDVAVVQTNRGLRFPAIECNPRFNGASYPTLVAQKLNIPAWCAINFSTKHRSLVDLNISDLEYNPNTGKGIAIVNWGTVLEGKLVILVAGDLAEQQALIIELENRL